MWPYGQHGNDTPLFPTPDPFWSVIYPNTYPVRDNWNFPYGGREGRRGRREKREDPPVNKSIALLQDKALDHHGDLGWNVEHATAWCYKHLVGNRPEVVDTINRVRTLDEVSPETPFDIFDYLDKALFASKLKGMVYLRWKDHASSAPGITSAPGVAKGISRIQIELNRTPFDEGFNDGTPDVDDLLDALIHQMIHAYFLVTCGAQPKGAKQDGRLMDGLHFGVIMLAIVDISQHCIDGPLPLVFHASKRELNRGASMSGRGYGGRSFISLDARGSAVGPAAADGQSHCNHDNRKIHTSQIINWQVEHYSHALSLDMESKGNVIYDLGGDQKLTPTDRLKGPPSSTYVELIWDQKRVMVSREKALAFQSLERPLGRHEQMELKIPECDVETFSCLYDFITKGVFAIGEAENQSTGPPVLAHIGTPNVQKLSGIGTFIKVFQVAEAMKFEELLRYTLKKLYELPVAYDDPIIALTALYEGRSPIHSELHKWARKFFLTRDLGSYDRFGDRDPQRRTRAFGSTNYEKLMRWYHQPFLELYYRCPGLRDDIKLIRAELAVSEEVEKEYGPQYSRRPRTDKPITSSRRVRLLDGPRRRPSFSRVQSSSARGLTYSRSPSPLSLAELEYLASRPTTPRQIEFVRSPSPGYRAYRDYGDGKLAMDRFEIDD